jgi:hypothetical protein
MRRRVAPRYRSELKEFLEEFVLQRPGLRLGNMFGCPGIYVGKKSCAYGDGLVVKLSPTTAQAELSKRSRQPFSPGGRRMRGWIMIVHPTKEGYQRERSLLVRAVAFVRREIRQSR